jgi:hypothetical protein
MKPNSNPRKVDILFWEFDNSNFFPNFRPGQVRTFGSLGVKTIWRVAPLNPPGIPSNFDFSIFSTSRNFLDYSASGVYPSKDLTAFNDNYRLLRYVNIWSGIPSFLDGSPNNGFGWVNLIGGLTGARSLTTIGTDGAKTLATVNFDSQGGITGIRNNFAYGIVQLGDFRGQSTTETSENVNYEGSFIFDKTPGTSEFASSVGGSNDEISIAVVDVEGKFGPRGAVLEKFELLSKAVDAKNLNNESIYYKDYINSNSRYIY